MINAHVAQKPRWQQQRRVLHGALATLSGKTKLSWVRKQVPAEVTVFLLFNDKRVLVQFFRLVVDSLGIKGI